ncbi:hypothetical protein jhhlp_003030 [Lomentospora prolificans]|uniref:Extracellular membrane protein CFEM domain-containing protein n=1 Tax=Lomentospora prolificans TaxID=41688 RepID=A0A2N3NFR0_9PEZI|nr:hypothetical protein jhhlp_003030 [Lomentospora prolificans]
MKTTSALILLATAALAAASDAPCTNESCTSLCNATPSCMSTLFDPETAQCYTFSCVLNNYSKPSKYLGYQKPGATYPCPADQPIPGEPQTPPATQPTANEDTPAAEPTSAAATPTPAPAPSGDASSSLVTVPRPSPTEESGDDGTQTTGSSSSPTAGSGDSSDDSGNNDGGADETSDPAAPTIVLDGAAARSMAPASLFVALGLAMVLF